MKKFIIVLDSFEYGRKENALRNAVLSYCEPVFFYTKYENKLTEVFQKTKYIGGILTHLSYWLLSLGYSLKLLLAKGTKDIVFINPIVGIFYSALTRCFFLKKNITIAGFLFESKNNKFYLSLRKKFVRFCYKYVKYIIVYGDSEVELYSNMFQSLCGKFVFLQYGRDYYYKDKLPFTHERRYVASGGRSNRNYETLCKAFEKTVTSAKYDCLIATRPECVTPELEKSNVNFLYGITLNQFGSFIEGAQIFILPLLNTNLSAGHMAMMEAMSVGVPILVTDIPAIRNYVDDSCVFFYKPDDSDDMASKIDYIIKNIESDEVKCKIQNSKLLYEKRYSFDALLQRIVEQSIK